MKDPFYDYKTPKQDRAITFLTQEEVQCLFFSVIKNKRDRAIFAVA